MQSLDERLKNTEVQQRKDYLTRQLNKLGIYRYPASDISLNDLSLSQLEWMHVEELNKAARAYQER